jgi:hypothetical protein
MGVLVRLCEIATGRLTLIFPKSLAIMKLAFEMDSDIFPAADTIDSCIKRNFLLGDFHSFNIRYPVDSNQRQIDVFVHRKEWCR